MLLLIAALAAGPVIWPEYLADWKRISADPVEVSDPVLDEYGLQVAERAEYALGPHRMIATGYRFRDAVGGYAAWLAMRPPEARLSDFADFAVQAGETVLTRFGNHVFRFDGGLPDYETYGQLVLYVPKLDQSELSPLKHTLPSGQAANSDRYLLGPESLAKYFPRVPPSVAAFRLGGEGMAARYGDSTLAVFSYPKGYDRCGEFSNLPGANVKCRGQYVAIAFDPGPEAVAALAAAPVEPPAPPVTDPPPPASPLFTVGVVAGLVLVALGLGFLLRQRDKRPAKSEEIRLNLGS
jgi:MYXO-CTERM domain-containing protein